MILTLIGMSGVGKSFWSAQLAEHGFLRFDCDQIIASKMGPMLGQTDATPASVAAWLGLPYEAGFPQREALYLASETETIYSALEYAKYCYHHGIDFVIDTGGSAIYAGVEVFNQLKCYSRIIYLMVSQKVYHQMVFNYITAPRSLIWNNLFDQQAAESFQEACSRCYPTLVRQREELYLAYSHLQFEYHDHRQLQFNIDQFLQSIQ